MTKFRNTVQQSQRQNPGWSYAGAHSRLTLAEGGGCRSFSCLDQEDRWERGGRSPLRRGKS